MFPSVDGKARQGIVVEGIVEQGYRNQGGSGKCAGNGNLPESKRKSLRTIPVM
jgi:hypothetical protein